MSETGKARRKAKRLKNQPQTVEPSGYIEDVAPRSISVLDFAAARAVELNAMKRAVESSSSTKQLFQTLPRHMRRRAASHNPKRLPRRLRTVAGGGNQRFPEGGSSGGEGKRQCRRFRRRAKCLREEYVRRQSGKRWLETHMWHAKRMKMVDCFGFRLAETNAGKGVRAAYRALLHGCLLHDLSYYKCIQLTGNQSTIIKTLESMTPPDTVNFLRRPYIVDASHEHAILLYRRHSYPHHLIGPTKLLWQQQTSKSAVDSVWLWMHPACVQEAFDELFSEFGEKPGQEVTVKLVDDLLRFRLIGPRSHAILSHVLHSVESEAFSVMACEGWDECGALCRDGWEFWSGIADCVSPSAVPSCVVIGLTVVDPRYLLPPRKVDMVSMYYPKRKAVKHQQDQTIGDSKATSPPSSPPTVTAGCLYQTITDKKLAVSPLWSPTIRQQVKEAKPPDHEINLRRSKLPIPGTQLPVTEETCQIPVVLIQQDGSRDVSSFGCGWDVVLPAGWGMAFWIALIYRGARAAALRDMERADVEMGKVSFPLHFPDSLAGQQQASVVRQQAEKKYLRYPPDKRPSYAKLGVTTPFYSDWNRLIKLWAEQTEEVKEPEAKRSKSDETQWYILRSKDTLQNIQHFITSRLSKPQTKKLPLEVRTLISKQLQRKSLSQLPFSPPPSKVTVPSCLHLSNALIHVSFTMLYRGAPSTLSMVCVPSVEDIASLQQSKSFSGPSECVHRSPEESTKVSCGDPDDGKTMEVFNGVTARPQIGYVLSGDFCFIRGCGRGIALCLACGLLQCVNRTPAGRKPLILIRENKSLQYRFAEFTVFSTC